MQQTIIENLYAEELYQVGPLITVILTKKWTDLSETEKGQLQKISDALRQRINSKLRLEGFQIVHQPELNLNNLTNTSSKVIYFGSAVNGLNYYELVNVNSTHIVLSENLEDLIKNEASRQKLWKALQQLFV